MKYPDEQSAPYPIFTNQLRPQFIIPFINHNILKITVNLIGNAIETALMGEVLK
jgi:hypothetical protein